MTYRFILILLIILPCAGIGQELTVEISNPAPFDRPLETVEVPWRELQGMFAAGEAISVSEHGSPLVSQIMRNDSTGDPESLIFQTGMLAKEAKRFAISKSNSAPQAQPLTDAKYILPRKDVAWENDRIAYRIYGGPLAGDVLNGVDVWVKRVRYLIMDKWYNGDSLKGKQRISYHVDHGEGADFFLVGRSLGAGGSAQWRDNKTDQAGMFAAYRIIATGPIRAKFSVTYERDSSRGRAFMEEKTFSLDAGMNLNRIDVRYPQDAGVGTAIGLVKRNDTKAGSSVREGWLSLWGATDNDSANGSLGTGIVASYGASIKILEDSIHHLMIVPSSTKGRLTYYAGAGWSRSGDFPTAQDWQKYLSLRARSLQYPLRLTISKK